MEDNMTPNEYQELCRRTVKSDQEQTTKIVKALSKYPAYSQMLIAALKLNSESGELADAIVKNLSYGQTLDRDNIFEECGDLLWYISLILYSIESSMERCMESNIEKLKIRYPEKYTDELAKERLDKKEHIPKYEDGSGQLYPKE